MDSEWIAKLLAEKQLTRMGHGQRAADLNLGLGWMYYGLVRAMRPKLVVVIGSYRGFTPMVFGKALADNAEGGRVVFVDPSLVDDFWTDAARVAAYFASYGVTNIEHHLATTQQFVETDAYRALTDVGIVFIDGYHSEQQAALDYRAFADRLAPDGVAMFHDTAKSRHSKIYGEDKAYTHRVREFVDTLKADAGLQVFDLPWFDGVSLVRRASSSR